MLRGFFGLYRGTVEDNADPSERGRLRVSVPAVSAELKTWALPCVPCAGEQGDLPGLPEPGAAVWIAFEAGDPSRPVWVGCLWPS